jgi:hypothetical protein
MFRRNISPPSSGSTSKPSKLSLPPSSTGFLLGLLFDLEDGGDIFPLNVRLSLNYNIWPFLLCYFMALSIPRMVGRQMTDEL